MQVCGSFACCMPEERNVLLSDCETVGSQAHEAACAALVALARLLTACCSPNRQAALSVGLRVRVAQGVCPVLQARAGRRSQVQP